jgi:hypothetical protein
MAILEPRVPTAKPVPQAQLDPKAMPATLALWVPLDLPEQRVPLVTPVIKATQEPLELRVKPALKVMEEIKDSKVKPAKQGQRVKPVRKDRVLEENKAKPDLKAPLEQRVQKDQPVMEARPERLETPVKPVKLEKLAKLATRATPATQAQPAPMV